MFFSVQIDLENDGNYHAVCPELGISTTGVDSNAAFDKLKLLLLEWLCEDFNVKQSEEQFNFFSNQKTGDDYALLNGNDVLYLLYAPRISIAN